MKTKKIKREDEEYVCCQFSIEAARVFVQELKDNRRKQVLFEVNEGTKEDPHCRAMTYDECFKKFDWLESKGFIMIPCCNNYDKYGFCQGH